jgi:O-methyltransferase involved in polyketide biosynthesis
MDSTLGPSPEKQESSHERVSVTAWRVAYRRTLSDIPFSVEVFDELQKIMRRTRSAAELQELDQLVQPDITPIFEARFKLVNRLLKEQSAKQILEIAAGFSPRSLAMARDPSVEYSEMDLPGVISEKRSVFDELIKQSKIPRYPNVHLNAGNALVMGDLLAAVKPFRKKPIVVVNEGLLRYLTFEEKTIVARNVQELLRLFGGMWITPDLSLRPQSAFGLSGERRRDQFARIERMTGIDVAKNYFENEEAARVFFEDLGFRIERHSFMEIVDELVSPQRLRLSSEQVEKEIGGLAVLVMKLR